MSRIERYLPTKLLFTLVVVSATYMIGGILNDGTAYLGRDHLIGLSGIVGGWLGRSLWE